jgi:hypothetical protein
MPDPNAHTASVISEEQECPRCEYTWDVLGLGEYGQLNPFDPADLICPDCGKNLLED